MSHILAQKQLRSIILSVSQGSVFTTETNKTLRNFSQLSVVLRSLRPPTSTPPSPTRT